MPKQATFIDKSPPKQSVSDLMRALENRVMIKHFLIAYLEGLRLILKIKFYFWDTEKTLQKF